MSSLLTKNALLARLLHVVGAGSVGAVAIGSGACGARSPLGAASGASVTTGAGGAATTSSQSSSSFASTGGLGGGGFGGGIIVIDGGSSSIAAVSVGSGPPLDGGLELGTACIPEQNGTCPSAGQAVGSLNGVLFPQCLVVVNVVNGPTVENGACCYEVEVRFMPCYVGRTFFIDEGIVKAELRAGRTWRDGPRPGADGLPAATRRALGEAWARDGLFEHASVASMSRFVMQLLALGAPADLVRDTLAAATDEVRHAELCLALASGYLGGPVEPTALPMQGPISIEADLAEVAAEAAMEGCIGETVATVQAIDALERATDPAVREVLAVTVRDEARHAEVAWRFVAWAIAKGGDRVREAVIGAFAGFRPADPRAEDLDGLDLDLYAKHGRQTAREGRALADRALAEIVRPTVCALVTERRPERGAVALAQASV